MEHAPRACLSLRAPGRGRSNLADFDEIPLRGCICFCGARTPRVLSLSHVATTNQHARGCLFNRLVKVGAGLAPALVKRAVILRERRRRRGEGCGRGSLPGNTPTGILRALRALRMTRAGAAAPRPRFRTGKSKRHARSACPTVTRASRCFTFQPGGRTGRTTSRAFPRAVRRQARASTAQIPACERAKWLPPRRPPAPFRARSSW